MKEFGAELQHAIELLDVDRPFTSRHLNDGFSGGEKKRAEILQMAMLKPDVAVLDETDSGLDIDALRTVAEGVKHAARRAGPGRPDHHPLPAHPALRQAAVRAHHDGRPDRAARAEPSWSSAWSARATTRSARRSGPAHAADDAARAKPGARRRAGGQAGRHRVATLYHALAGAGAGGRAHARRAARGRAAGLRGLGAADVATLGVLDDEPARPRPGGARAAGTHEAADGVPEIVARGVADEPRAGRLVQRGGKVVHVELDPELAEPRRGPLLARGRRPRARRARRAELLHAPADLDRDKLEAATAAFWSGGAFLHVPAGLVVEDPSRSSTRSTSPASPSTRTRSSSASRAQRLPPARVRPRARTSRARRCTPGTSSVPGGRRALPPRPRAGLGLGRGPRRLDPRSCASAATPTATGCRPLLGGHLARQHLELAVAEPGGDMAFRGIFFTEGDEHLDLFAVDLHETGPLRRRRALARRRHRLEPRELRGPDQDRPGRAAVAHLPADPLDDALAEGQASTRSRRCSWRPTTSRPRTAAPSASSTSGDLLHAVARTRPAERGRVIVEGFFEPLIVRARGRAAGGAGARAGRRQARGRARGHRGLRGSQVMATTTTAALDVRADFPILARRFDGRPLVYLDSARDLAEAARR